MTTVLLAVCDRNAGLFLGEQLRADDYDVVAAGTRDAALELAAGCIVTVAVIDLWLSQRRGARLIREVRDEHHRDLPADLPILGLLPPNACELELARAFDAGADDVARQPIGYVELRCRIDALLRRCRQSRRHVRRHRVAGLEVDTARRTANLGEQTVALSKLEFDLLAVLASDPERVFTKRELLADVWGMPDGISTRTLDSHACRLRHKLAQAGGRFIDNRWGVGYALLPVT